jgi:hypothetical protein
MLGTRTVNWTATRTKGALVVGLGLAALVVGGCKQKVAVTPVQPVVLRSVPKVPSPFGPMEDLPDPDAVKGNGTQVRAPRHAPVVRVPPSPPSGPSPEALAAAAAMAQKAQDTRLLQDQQAASQRQQKELDQTVQQSIKATQQMQEEPRIQDAPGPAPDGGIQDAPGPVPGDGIQDAPGPTPGDGIQDAPGPAQTNPPPAQPQPAQPEPAPQL